MADSHLELPVVDAPAEELETDLAPFIRLHDAPMAMTAHVVYSAWDKAQCASLSAKIISGIIRHRIGFDGLLMSDDLGMHALKGDFGERAAGVIAAGCDVALHCSGDMGEMIACADAVLPLTAEARIRLDRAMATIGEAGKADPFEALIEKRDQLLALA
jgi:beta-N-acetylhexosaminidase